VLRRFEVYAIGADSPAGAVRRFEEACRRSGRHVPEVLDSAVGWNRSGAPVHLVWEHAFASPEAYRRYMVHPFHAAVLDRYILQDSPERVVTDDTLGAGLVGYSCDDAVYRLRRGVRRLVLLRLRAEAPAGAVERLWRRLHDAPAASPSMVVSVAAANTMGPAWFDGMTPITGPPRWTHLWEQGFASEGGFDDYRHGPSALAAVERGGSEDWGRWSDGVVTRVADVHYVINGNTDDTAGDSDEIDNNHTTNDANNTGV
jgi:hypothetical protein